MSVYGKWEDIRNKDLDRDEYEMSEYVLKGRDNFGKYVEIFGVNMRPR